MIVRCTIRLGLALLAIATLSACGSKPQTSDTTGVEKNTASKPVKKDGAERSAATTRASVCALLPKAEMEVILGGPLTDVSATDSPGKTQCTYVGFGRFADVAIEWGNGESGMAGTRLASKLMGATAGQIAVTTPIENLGDEALMLIGGVLNVRKGADLITVDLRTQKNTEVIGPTIARKVIEKM